MIELIPEPYPKGFVEDVKQSYTNDRYSEVSCRPDREVPTVTIVSGEHPAYSRFIQDTRKYLYRNGFILRSAENDKYVGLDEEKEPVRRHVVTGIPLIWVVAEINGFICNRGACKKLVESYEKTHCKECGNFLRGDNEWSEDDDVRYTIYG